MRIGIRQLKQDLSATLDRVQAGETVIVTDRGIPKAVISPVVDSSGLDEAIEQGRVRPPREGARVGLPLRLESVRPAVDLLSEDRGV